MGYLLYAMIFIDFVIIPTVAISVLIWDEYHPTYSLKFHADIKRNRCYWYIEKE